MFTTSLNTSVGGVVLAHLLFVISFLLAASAIFISSERLDMSLLALFILLPGGLLLARQRQFAVDRRQQRYCRCVLFFGLPIGKWQPLPPVAWVVLKPYSEYQTAPLARSFMDVWQTTGPLKSCVVLLSVEGSSQGIVVGKALIAREAAARQAAQQLAAYLGVELWEAE